MSDFDHMIEANHRAVDAFVRGDPAPLKALWSPGDDVSVANPLFPAAHGWQDAAETMDRAAVAYRDGRALAFDLITRVETPALAFVVELEHYDARVGDRSDLTPIVLRVTSIFRREGSTWRIVHRHADPITTAQPFESVIAVSAASSRSSTRA
jgi:hypothetical protein